MSNVADLDLKGLKMANFLGSKTINLAERKIEENNFDLITIVHVLEHLDKLKNHFVTSQEGKKLKKKIRQR